MPLPTVIVPGYFARATEYQPLANALNQEGIPTQIVPLRKRDWVPTLGGRSVVPILNAIDRTVKQMQEKYNRDRVNLIGHSAGGWISRIYLGEKPYDIHGDVAGDEAIWQGRDRVATLIALGTPHTSQERWTRRNLEFVSENYPGAFCREVNYVCVAGKAIYGDRRWGSWVAHQSYKLTCGRGECWGDGITPIAAAHLDGATNLILEGVRHAPTSGGIWYGSPEVRGEWMVYLA